VRRLAELLGAPVIDLQGRLNMATRHPLNFTGSEAVLAEADLVLSVDVGDLSRALNRLDRGTHQKQSRIPEGCTIIDLGLMELRSSKWSEDLGAFQPVDHSIVADSALALPALRELISADASALWPGRRKRNEEENAKLRAEVQKKSREHWDDAPIWPARLASEVWDAIKGEDWVLTANDLEDWAWKLWDIDSPVRWPGRSLGTATQIGISIGVALAHRGDGKLIVDIQPDGDLLFDPGALWTAANLKLPMLLVMYNNRAYYNDWEHQLRVADKRGTDKAKAYIGMDLSDPAPDFAMLAKSFGWYSEGPIDDPKDVAPALARAIAAIKKDGRPALLDTIVRKRELTRFR
jgi:acetolactate synthase-1/2/3 large subunit